MEAAGEDDHNNDAPPYLNGANVLKFNTANVLSLSPVVTLPVAPAKDGQERVLIGLPAQYHSRTGLLLPLERISFVGPALRRMRVALDFSLVVQLPVDEYERPLVVLAEGTPELDVKQKKLPFIFLQHEEPDQFKYQLHVLLSAAFDYERWYYALKGVQVEDPQGRSRLSESDEKEQKKGRGELYDPLPLARFLPIPADILQILYDRGVKMRNAQQSAGNTNFTEDELQLHAKASQYFQEELFDSESLKGETKEYFFRLSNMSPKDVLIHLVEPAQNGLQVVQRLTASGRALNGMKAVLGEKRNPDPGQTLQLVLLPWDASIGQSVEFRCFVHNKRLCAISQYDLSVSPLLQVPERLSLYKRLIEQFYQQLAPHIPYESCVMDLIVKHSGGLTPATSPTFETAVFTQLDELSEGEAVWQGEEKEKWRVFLLEFNPFYADGDSGTSLFDWKREFSIIYNGAKIKNNRDDNSEEECGDDESDDSCWTSVLRYRIPDPNRRYRGAAEGTPREPRIRDVLQ